MSVIDLFSKRNPRPVSAETKMRWVASAKSFARSSFVNLLTAVGLGSVAYGCSLWSRALGFVIAGLLILGLAFVAEFHRGGNNQ